MTNDKEKEEPLSKFCTYKGGECYNVNCLLSTKCIDFVNRDAYYKIKMTEIELLQAKISHLESIIQAADKLQVHCEYALQRALDSKGACYISTMERGDIETDLKKYNELKKQQ